MNISEVKIKTLCFLSFKFMFFFSIHAYAKDYTGKKVLYIDSWDG